MSLVCSLHDIKYDNYKLFVNSSELAGENEPDALGRFQFWHMQMYHNKHLKNVKLGED